MMFRIGAIKGKFREMAVLKFRFSHTHEEMTRSRNSASAQRAIV